MLPLVETASGQFVHLVHPEPTTIRVADIAHALARINRYNGHTGGPRGYSVAQHSVWVARICEGPLRADPTVCLYALLHDAHEAYMGDVVSPLKQLPGLRALLKDIEHRLQAAIHEALGLPPPLRTTAELIRRVDAWALHAEASHYLPSGGLGWPLAEPCPEVLRRTVQQAWEPWDAEARFLEACRRYQGGEDAA